MVILHIQYVIVFLFGNNNNMDQHGNNNNDDCYHVDYEQIQFDVAGNAWNHL